MSYTNQQIAQQIATLLNKNRVPYFQKGITTSTGINREITVKLANGKVIRALGWNVSIPGEVNVFWDETNKRYIAWREETNSLKRKTLLANRKTRGIDKKYAWEYYVKILQTSSIEGFDDDISFDLTGYEPLGITNTGREYFIVLKNGNSYKKITQQNTQDIEFLPNNFLNNTLPTIQYPGKSFWYRRAVSPVAENFQDNSNINWFFTWSVSPCFITLAYSALNQRTANTLNFPIAGFNYHYRPSAEEPNNYNQLIIPPLAYCRYFFYDSIIGDYYKLGVPLNSGERIIDFDYRVGQNSYPNSRSLALSRVNDGNGSTISESLSFETNTQYPVAIESGFTENPSNQIYVINQSGTGSRTINTVLRYFTGYTDPVSENTVYATSFNVQGNQSQNDEVFRLVSYTASQSRNIDLVGVFVPSAGSGDFPDVWGDSQESITQTENWTEKVKTSVEMLYKSESIEFKVENFLHTNFVTEYTGDYQQLAKAPAGEYSPYNPLNYDGDPVNDYDFIEDVNCTLTENVYLDDRSVSTLKIGNNAYTFSSYSGTQYTPSQSYYLVTDSNLQTIKVSVNFDDSYGTYVNIVSKRIATRGYTKNTNLNPSVTLIDSESFEHVTQNIAPALGLVDSFVKTSGNSALKNNGNATFNRSLQVNDDGSSFYDYSDVTYSQIAIDQQEYFALLDAYTEGTYVFVPVNNYTEVIYFLLSNYRSRINIYTVTENEVDYIELAITEKPTTTNPEKLRVDIYRFNTTTLKWERRPNAVSLVSNLTSASDFVSYHPTASNSRRRNRRPPRS